MKKSKYTDAQQNTNTGVYGTQGWPILTLDSRVADYSAFALRLRTDHNTRPVLYIQYLDVGDIYDQQFTDSEALLNEDATPGWTKDVVMHFPHVTEGSATYSIAQYMTLNYFEAPELPVQGPQNRGINSTNEIDAYYNNAFCATQLADVDNNAFTFAVQTEAAYVDGQFPDSDISFAYAGDAGANWNDSKVVFYAKSVFTQKRSGIDNSEYLRSQMEGFSLDGDINKQSFLIRELVIRKTSIYEAIGNDEYREIEVLKMRNNGSSNQSYEDVISLGMTQLEFEQFTNSTGLSEYHHSYPYLEMLDDALTDLYGTIYQKFRLGRIGINNNREWTISFPLIDIILYSINGLFFTSLAFVASNIRIKEEENLLLSLEELSYKQLIKTENTNWTVKHINSMTDIEHIVKNKTFQNIALVHHGNIYSKNKPTDERVKMDTYFFGSIVADTYKSFTESQKELSVDEQADILVENSYGYATKTQCIAYINLNLLIQSIAENGNYLSIACTETELGGNKGEILRLIAEMTTKKINTYANSKLTYIELVAIYEYEENGVKAEVKYGSIFNAPLTDDWTDDTGWKYYSQKDKKLITTNKDLIVRSVGTQPFKLVNRTSEQFPIEPYYDVILFYSIEFKNWYVDKYSIKEYETWAAGVRKNYGYAL